LRFLEVDYEFILERKLEFRDRFFELINRKDDEFEKYFKNLPLYEKKKIIQIINDPHLLFLYETLVIYSQILTKDEYYNTLIKLRYPNKIIFLNSPQSIQFASIII